MKLNKHILTVVAILLCVVTFAGNGYYTESIGNVQPSTLTLTVLDANGQPVIGAAVMKADGSGEITDLDGVCTISLSGSDETLTVVCMGYQTKTLTVGGGR